MRKEMLDLMVTVAGIELYEVGAGFDREGERTMRETLTSGRCVEIDIPESGGTCTIRNVGVTDAGRVRFMRNGVEDEELRRRFDKPIIDWVARHRGR